MAGWLRAHWQPALVGGLLLASLATLAGTGAGVFLLPHLELEGLMTPGHGEAMYGATSWRTYLPSMSAST